MDVLYAHMSKAFDKVSHNRLLLKLSSFGVQSNLLSWFKSYLKKRPLKVVFNGAESNEFFPTTGVPQGSILGPLLFLIYVNDITNQVTSTISLYADDLKVKTIIENGDYRKMKDDIRSINQWC